MSPSGSFRRRVDSSSLEEPGRSPRQACVCYLADEGVIVGKADGPQTPCKQPAFSGVNVIRGEGIDASTIDLKFE